MCSWSLHPVLSVVGSSERSEPKGQKRLLKDNFAGSGPSIFGLGLAFDNRIGCRHRSDCILRSVAVARAVSSVEPTLSTG